MPDNAYKPRDPTEEARLLAAVAKAAVRLGYPATASAMHELSRGKNGNDFYGIDFDAIGEDSPENIIFYAAGTIREYAAPEDWLTMTEDDLSGRIRALNSRQR